MTRIEYAIQNPIRPNREVIIIGTHGARFHADEIVAIAMIEIVFENYEFHIVRTRDPNMLEQCDIVLDVGNTNSGRWFDHHDRDFKETHYLSDTKMATTGLVWDDIQNLLVKKFLPHASDEILNIAKDYILNEIIIPVDGIDNGVKAPHLSLSKIISAYNAVDTLWQPMQFEEAIKMTKKIMITLFKEIAYRASCYTNILEAMRKAPLDEQNEGIFVMRDLYGPWISVAVGNWLETIHYKVCVYKTEDNPLLWKIQSFPLDKFNLAKGSRCPAPEDLRGRGNIDLNAIIPNTKGKLAFVHAKGILAGVFGEEEDAYAFAKYWIEQSK